MKENKTISMEEVKVLVDKAERRRSSMESKMLFHKEAAKRVKAPLKRVEFDKVKDKLTFEQYYAYCELQISYERYYSAKRVLNHYTNLYYKALEARGIEIEPPF